MASVEWERSGDRPLPASVEPAAREEPHRSLTALPAEARPLSEQKFQGSAAQEAASAPLPSIVVTPAQEEPVEPQGGADPYEAAVEQLFALLEENQVAIAALAQAWRHKSRVLELTQAELAHTQETLAAERRLRRRS